MSAISGPERVLISEEYAHMTGNIPAALWEPWAHLMSEALWYGHERRAARLLLQMQTGNSVHGWGAEKLVEALQGRMPSKRASASATLAPGTAGSAPTADAETGPETVVPATQDTSEDPEPTRRRARRLRLGRLP